MTTTARSAHGAGIDFEQFRLRRFIEALSGSPELEIRTEPIDLVDVAAVLDGNPHAVLFRAVGPERAELVGAVTASRERIARGFGVPANALLAEVTRRMALAPQVVEVDSRDAPVHERIERGDDVDLTTLPAHLQHAEDGAPYISAAIDFAVDTRSGITNVGVRRLMLRGRRETGIDLVSPSDLRAIYEASAARGEPLPIAFAVGSHPVDYVAAMMRLPGDELGILSSMRGAPLPVVRGVTVDVRYPADAELVLEGYLDARGHVEPEGPYGEFLGYYGGVKRNPVFHCTAIVRRGDALFQTATISGRAMGRTDTSHLNAIRCEAMVLRALQSAVREPLAVCATPSSGGAFNVRIAIRQRVPGEAKNAIAAAHGCLANVKHVFVVDPDIDVFSDEQIDWAFATRFQADRDLVVQHGLRTLPLDPSLGPGVRIGAKLGFDCTRPLGAATIETRVPEPPAAVDGPRFASVFAALADGPKRFEELMAAVGSRDGREIVREIEQLRADERVGRDPEGRYLLGSEESPQ